MPPSSICRKVSEHQAMSNTILCITYLTHFYHPTADRKCQLLHEVLYSARCKLVTHYASNIHYNINSMDKGYLKSCHPSILSSICPSTVSMYLSMYLSIYDTRPPIHPSIHPSIISDVHIRVSYVLHSLTEYLMLLDMPAHVC